MTAINHSNVVGQQGVQNPRPDIAIVFGVQDAATILGEQLCKEFGFRVHRAMKRDDPTSPIESIEDEAVIVPDLGCVDTVHVCGFKSAKNLSDDAGGPIECNYVDDDGSAFAYPLTCMLYADEEGGTSLPSGWVLRDIPGHPSQLLAITDERRARLWQEAECQHQPVGFFGPAGTVVADFGNGRKLLEIPSVYRQMFPLIENRKFF